MEVSEVVGYGYATSSLGGIVGRVYQVSICGMIEA